MCVLGGQQICSILQPRRVMLMCFCALLCFTALLLCQARRPFFLRLFKVTTGTSMQLHLRLTPFRHTRLRDDDGVTPDQGVRLVRRCYGPNDWSWALSHGRAAMAVPSARKRRLPGRGTHCTWQGMHETSVGPCDRVHHRVHVFFHV